MLITDYGSYIEYQDGFIDDPEMYQKLLAVRDLPVHYTNKDQWSDHLTYDDFAKGVRIWDGERALDKEVHDYVCLRAATCFPLIRSNEYLLEIMFHDWDAGSYIAWHDDGHKDFALTCYLDSKDCDGGMFLVKEHRINTYGSFIEPIENRCLLIRNMFHCVTPVITGRRFSMQIWGTKNANI